MGQWGQGFYGRQSGSRVDSILAEMTEARRVREETDREMRARVAAALMQNPSARNYELAKRIGVDPGAFTPTEEERLKDTIAGRNRGIVESYTPDRFESRYVAAENLLGRNPNAQFTETIRDESYMPPADFAKANRVRGGLDLAAKDEEGKRQFETKWPFERRKTEAEIGKLGAETVTQGALAGKYGAEGDKARREGTSSWFSPSSNKSAASSKPSTAAQKRVLNFYIRAKDAIDQLETPYGPDGRPLHEVVGNKGTLKQGWLNMAPNFAQPEENQLYTQAQRQFTEARLRKDSGAAIPEFEFENDRRTYFAQPGDGPKVIERKKMARENILKALRMEAGPAYGEYFGQEESTAAGAGKPLDEATAQDFLRQAGGDKNKARELARAAGYTF